MGHHDWERSGQLPATFPMRVVFTPCGHRLISADWLWDPDAPGAASIISRDVQSGLDEQVLAVDRTPMEITVSPNGRFLAWITWHGMVEIYDLEAHRMLSSRQAHRAAGMAIAFSPDGSTLATGA